MVENNQAIDSLDEFMSNLPDIEHQAPHDARLGNETNTLGFRGNGEANSADGNESSRKQIIRNRRFKALQSLLATEFFSDEAMEERAPALFKDMLGRYLGPSKATAAGARTEEGIGATIANSISGPFNPITNMLMSAVERQIRSGSDAAANTEHAGDDDAEEEEGSSAASQPLDPSSEEAVDLAIGRSSDVDIVERRNELLQLMSERFLRGDDAAFYDYRQVDEDEELDVSAEADRDREEAYFDSS